MPKLGDKPNENPLSDYQAIIDQLDIIGIWDWDIAGDHVFADHLVAMLFNVDPTCAALGLPLATYIDGIHPEDKSKTQESISQSAMDGTSYVAEYRVCSMDGVTRWVLARGRFELDATGRPSRGRGILIDITQSKISEDTFFFETSSPSGHPLERIADHCLAIRDETEALQDSLVRQLANMLLLEAGRGLAKLETAERRKRMN